MENQTILRQRFKYRMANVFLWMVLGSMALNVKWTRMDIAETKTKFEVAERKLRREYERSE
jgi:hypothetical protein